jgi:hypothetical protein
VFNGDPFNLAYISFYITTSTNRLFKSRFANFMLKEIVNPSTKNLLEIYEEKRLRFVNFRD